MMMIHIYSVKHNQEKYYTHHPAGKLDKSNWHWQGNCYRMDCIENFFHIDFLFLLCIDFHLLRRLYFPNNLHTLATHWWHKISNRYFLICIQWISSYEQILCRLATHTGRLTLIRQLGQLSLRNSWGFFGERANLLVN